MQSSYWIHPRHFQEPFTMKVGIAKEIGPGERRVAVTPDSVRQIKAAGYDVLVEAGAGAGASTPDAKSHVTCAGLVTSTAGLWSRSRLPLTIPPPLHKRSPTPPHDDRL